MLNKLWISFLDIVFPSFCLGCKKEGSYLCEDCQAALEISNFHRKENFRHLNGLYYASPYQNALTKKLIQKFKYEPFIKELAKPLSAVIISHFKLIENYPAFSSFAFAAVPLEKSKLKRRGFNQSEELAKILAGFFDAPLLKEALEKKNKTPSQTELSNTERRENVKGCFFVPDKKAVEGKNIALVDDVFTTGATMEECAKTLKEARAEKVIGITAARG